VLTPPAIVRVRAYRVLDQLVFEALNLALTHEEVKAIR
jgi:hypothetical protein